MNRQQIIKDLCDIEGYVFNTEEENYTKVLIEKIADYIVNKNYDLHSVRNSKTFDFTYETDVKEKRLP